MADLQYVPTVRGTSLMNGAGAGRKGQVLACGTRDKDACCMSCVLLNARSIRSKFDEFKCFVAVKKPDIICITETWVSETLYGDILQEFELHGYNMFSYCRDMRQGGGVFIYVNSLYNAIEVEYPLKRKEIESIWVDIRFGAGIGDLRLGCFYRPGNLPREPQAEVDQFICDEIRRNFKNKCIIMGDFNLRGYCEMIDTQECLMFREMFEEELFLHQFVTEPTRIGAILDLVFSDSKQLINELTVCEGLGNSDHCSVVFNISVQVKPKNNPVMVPNFNRADFDSMKNELASVNWNSEFTDLDACEAWDVFKEILDNVQRRNIPRKQKRKRVISRPHWLTPEVKEAIHIKRKTFSTRKNSPTELTKRSYQKRRDEVKKIIRKAKREKELDLARSCSNDSKKFFSYYKMGVSKNIGPLKSDGMIVCEDKGIVELFNKQFKSVFTEEDHLNMSLIGDHGVTDKKMKELGTITKDEVLIHMRKIKINKSEGPDNIYARVLRECENELSLPLSIIFNKSLSETKIPFDWKRANVVPIFKNGDKSKVENYRPVSLTSLVCKTLESIIKENIVKFLEDNNIIAKTQHGFMRNRSCLTNLLEFLDIAYDSFDKGKQLDVAYLDFSKAFDRVPHKRLGLQLENHGICGRIGAWIQDWLTERQQRVILNGKKSAWATVLSGVPQGSVLGPLLFLIFINTIENNIDSKVLKFADDMKVFRVIGGNHDEDTLQIDLDRLVEWSRKWQMNFNFDKCKLMNIGREKIRTSYQMGGQTLTKIEKEKDLGVIINTKLSVSDQVCAARRKALKMLGAIHRNVQYKNGKVICKLYSAFVRPHLEYCVQAWSPMFEKDCWLLERVQKRATKMVNGLRNLPYEDRLRTLDLFSLKYRRLRGDLIEVFKFIKGEETGYLSGLFEFDEKNRGRCHQYKLLVKYSRTRLRQSFSIEGF